MCLESFSRGNGKIVRWAGQAEDRCNGLISQGKIPVVRTTITPDFDESIAGVIGSPGNDGLGWGTTIIIEGHNRTTAIAEFQVGIKGRRSAVAATGLKGVLVSRND